MPTSLLTMSTMKLASGAAASPGSSGSYRSRAELALSLGFVTPVISSLACKLLVSLHN